MAVRFNIRSKERIKKRQILSKILEFDHVYGEEDRTKRRQQRKSKYKYNRLDMKSHFDMCRHTSGFQKRYHMTEHSFQRLLKILEDDLQVNLKQSLNSTGGNAPITPEMKVAIGLRFMGGEKSKSLADIFGISLKSADRSIDNFLEAVDKSEHKDLSIDLLPEKEMDRNRMAVEWNQRSGAYHILYGMVGAIDGWLCTTERPSDVPNPSEFFSGHYQRFGFNCQAVCDANLRFIYFLVAGPGKSDDAQVFRKLTRLRYWVDSLSPRFFITVCSMAVSCSSKHLK